MATTLVMIDPVSGDDSAAIFDSSGEVLQTVDKGTILKVISEDNNGYQVAVDPPGENMWQGGSSDRGCIIADPWTYMYTDINRKFVVSKINKGTVIQVLDADYDCGMFKISGRSVDGNKEGWVQFRYVCLEPMQVEEGDSE